MRKWLGIAALGACGLLIAACAVMWAVWRTLNSPMAIGEEPVVLEVPPGSSLIKLGDELEARGMLRHPRMLAWYARLTGDATRIRADRKSTRLNSSHVKISYAVF